jgi:hypothetical protein
MGVKQVWAVVPATALGAALLMGAGAGAALQPTAKVVSAKVKDASVAFAVDVVFPGSPCTGKATLSAAGHHWSAPAKLLRAACRARVHGTLPKKDYGKRLTFRFAIAGRKGSSRLKLKSGPLAVPVPSYLNGGWQGRLSSPMNGFVQFTVIDGAIQGGLDSSSGFLLDCTDPNDQPVKTFFILHIKPSIPLQVNGNFSRRYHDRTDPDTTANGSGEDMVMSASGRLGNGTGTMTMTANGSLYFGHASGQTRYDESNCHGTNTFPVYKSP